LECDGSSLVRVDFSDLFDAIGIVWGTADAASFNLPDMRGRFPRGYDHGATIDPNAGTRTASNTGGATGDNVGSVQADVFGTHRHGITSWSSNGTESGWNVEATDNQQFGQTATDGFAVQDTGGAETRPKNASVMYIIKT
jgi:microcystin-dependent protein